MHKNKIGVLLLNLGTPTSPDKKAVKRYLKEFLDDPRVIDLPWLFRKALLHLVILPFRPAKSAKAYAAIWDEKKGSPLLYHSVAFAEQLQTSLGTNYSVELGMRYATPNITVALQKLLQKKVRKIIILPLFPQYSSSATGSAIEKALGELSALQNIPGLTVHSEFYNAAGYIDAQSAILAKHLKEFQPDAVLFSYHSLPVRHIHKSQSQCDKACFAQHPCPVITSDNAMCYRAQCYETSRLIAQQCDLEPNKYAVAFQSRLGRTEWIGPDLKSTMQQLIARNVKNVLVACPSFVADCLETLEEVGIRAKKEWQELGGKEFILTPCLNSHPLWVQAVENLVYSLSPEAAHV